MDLNEYSGLVETGFEGGGKPQTKPEDEFFHSVYISGKPRTNDSSIDELPGKLQIRGFKYNLDNVHIIITNVKKVLVKEEEVQGKTRTTCFSFKNGNSPWKSSTGQICGVNSAERAANKFCSICKEHIIVSGILCNETGRPEVKDNKPIFVFLRAKGMKYMNVGNYLNEMTKLDLTPLIKPVTEESKKFEKMVVNNKRFVTIIKVGSATSKYGVSQVFDMSKGNELSENDVKKVLDISKKTLEQFNEKFDWSKRTSTSGYTPPKEENQFVDPGKSKETTMQQEQKKTEQFSFDDIEF